MRKGKSRKIHIDCTHTNQNVDFFCMLQLTPPAASDDCGNFVDGEDQTRCYEVSKCIVTQVKSLISHNFVYFRLDPKPKPSKTLKRYATALAPNLRRFTAQR